MPDLKQFLSSRFVYLYGGKHCVREELLDIAWMRKNDEKASVVNGKGIRSL